MIAIKIVSRSKYTNILKYSQTNIINKFIHQPLSRRHNPRSSSSFVDDDFIQTSQSTHSRKFKFSSFDHDYILLTTIFEFGTPDTIFVHDLIYDTWLIWFLRRLFIREIPFTYKYTNWTKCMNKHILIKYFLFVRKLRSFVTFIDVFELQSYFYATFIFTYLES